LAFFCLISGGQLLTTDWALSNKRAAVNESKLDSAYLSLSDDLSSYQLARKVGERLVYFHDRVVAQLPELSGLMSQFMGIFISAARASAQLSEADEREGLIQLPQLLQEITQLLRHKHSS